MTARRALGGAGAVVLLLLAASAAAQAPGSPGRPPVRHGPAIKALNGFVANHGQWSPEVLFFAKNLGIEATLTADAMVFQPQRDPEAVGPASAPLVLRLPKASIAEGQGLVPTKTSLGSLLQCHAPTRHTVAVFRVPLASLTVRAWRSRLNSRVRVSREELS